MPFTSRRSAAASHVAPLLGEVFWQCPLLGVSATLDFALEHTKSKLAMPWRRGRNGIEWTWQTTRTGGFGLWSLPQTTAWSPLEEMRATVPLRDSLEPREVSVGRPLWVWLGVQTGGASFPTPNQLELSFPVALCGSLLGMGGAHLIQFKGSPGLLPPLN